MEREKLGKRLGFILLSAGCAIGIGNVWRFPYVAGKYGGGVFVFFYLFFLLVMGLPIMTMEFAVGRASKKSIIKSFGELERPGQKWHLHGYVGLVGNYCLMMFYTTIAGWMLYYFFLMLTGRFVSLDVTGVENVFAQMLLRPGVMTILMLIVVVVGFDNYLAETNSGNGWKMPRWLRGYLTFVLPIMIIFLFVEGIIGKLL